ncbi:MAG: stage V sporulation protein AD [Clostridia bacterium]|nr:stage V sporulation protein AD [Clostridia bacterium]
MTRAGDTLFFESPVWVNTWAAAVGTKEGQGPLGAYFDYVTRDNRFGKKTWEQAESRMVELACEAALAKTGLELAHIDCVLGGDLLNQCISTGFAARGLGLPYFGLYGACSTMAESLILGAALVSGGFARRTLCLASSHFCSAERQYRYPLEYGGQRPPTAQWTATACGAAVLQAAPSSVRVTAATPGRVYDPGITDSSNMGAAMAQSAYETLRTFFRDSGTGPEDYDLIVTGDLASVGHGVVLELFRRDGVTLGDRYQDCGMLLYDQSQDVHAGASGCGCSAAVLCGRILPDLAAGKLKKVLFCGTGAMMSPVSANQGESIPGICHLVCLEGGL